MFKFNITIDIINLKKLIFVFSQNKKLIINNFYCVH